MNIFGFINPMIYLVFLVIYDFDSDQTLFILICFLLGFLTDLNPEGFEASLEQVLSGQFLEEKRFLLEVFQSFERPFTPRTWLQSASHLAKTRFR